MASAFIVQINSELQQDPNEEAAALLRVLIYKVDNTTFGGNVPVVPQWSGPPRAIVQVQAILYASLAASLFSAFLAMLGKQWLNRYASIGVRGSAIERSQNRQQKLNGIINWYFGHMMELLPLMLQVALLLLGCALSRYLWEINVTVAWVVLGATSFGVVFYLSIVVAGAVFTSCPYQTPWSRVLHSTTSSIASAASAISSAFRRALERSETVEIFRLNVECHHPWWSKNNIGHFSRDVLCESLPALAMDGRRLGRTVVQSLVTLTRQLCILLPGAPSTRMHGHGSDHRVTLLDLDCISWTLHTSLDKDDHSSTLEYLTTIAPPTGFDPSLVVDCFNILVGCMRVVNSHVVTPHGLEQLETASALCLLHTFSHLSVMGPMPTVLTEVRLRYQRVFPPDAVYKDHPLYHTLGAIYNTFYPDGNHRWLDWGNHRPTAHEHIVVARSVARLAQLEYQRREPRKVPRWILRFAFHSLAQDPPPPTSVVVDCLFTIAVDMGCDVSKVGTPSLDKRCVQA